jgi:hypothetical protein
MSRVAPLVLLLLAACNGPRRVAVQVLVPDLAGIDTPIPGAVIAALPYDRDSIIASMERRAATKRPNTDILDSLFQAFHDPFLAFSRAAWRVEQTGRRRDSVARARASAPAGSPAGKELDARLRALDDSLEALGPALERARTALSAARDTLWPRIEQLRAAAKAWEASTYAGYDTLVRSQTTDKMQTPSADTTGAAGWATLRLLPGAWWIHARSPDPQDPNFQWYWNVPLTGDTVRLNPASGRRLPRY